MGSSSRDAGFTLTRQFEQLVCVDIYSAVPLCSPLWGLPLFEVVDVLLPFRIRQLISSLELTEVFIDLVPALLEFVYNSLSPNNVIALSALSSMPSRTPV